MAHLTIASINHKLHEDVEFNLNKRYKLYTRIKKEGGEWDPWSNDDGVRSFDYLYSSYQYFHDDRDEGSIIGINTIWYECDPDGNERKIIGSIRIPWDHIWRIGSSGSVRHSVTVRDLTHVDKDCEVWPCLQTTRKM